MMQRQLTNSCSPVFLWMYVIDPDKAELKKALAGSSHLAALTGADPVVVPWGLVLAHKAGLVDTRWGRWRRRTGYHLLRAGALGLHRCEKDSRAHEHMIFQKSYYGYCSVCKCLMCICQYMWQVWIVERVWLHSNMIWQLTAFPLPFPFDLQVM